MEGHELQIVLMGANSEVGDALQGRILLSSVGNKNFCSGVVKFHECGGMFNGFNGEFPMDYPEFSRVT